MFYQRRAPDADAYPGERAEAAAGTTGAGNPFPESSLAEARNHSPARPSSLSTSISFPAPTCLVGLPRPAQMRRNRPRMGGNSASPASSPPLSSLRRTAPPQRFVTGTSPSPPYRQCPISRPDPSAVERSSCPEPFRRARYRQSSHPCGRRTC